MLSTETPVAKVRLENDIVYLLVNGNVVFTLAQMKDHYRTVHEMTGGGMVGVLIDTRDMSYSDVSGEVLRYMADNEYVKCQVAAALVINNLSLRMIGNIYLELFGPKVRTRIFTSEERARNWLQEAMREWHDRNRDAGKGA